MVRQIGKTKLLPGTCTAECVPKLRDYLQTTSHSLAANLLARTMSERITLLLDQYIQVKWSAAEDVELQDLQELTGEWRAAMLERIMGMCSGTAAPIRNLGGYAKIVAQNAWNQPLHRRYPRRTALVDRVFYLVNRDTGFANLKSETGTTLKGPESRYRAGLATRNRYPFRANPALAWEPAAAVVKQAGNLVFAMRAVLNWVSHPCDEDAYISTLAASLCSSDLQPLSMEMCILDLNGAPLSKYSMEDRASLRVALQSLWRDRIHLSLPKRRALLLNLRDNNGRGVVQLFPNAGVAIFNEIAMLLEIPITEFTVLWSHLRLNDLTIGNMMSSIRQQIINPRQEARRNLTSRFMSS